MKRRLLPLIALAAGLISAAPPGPDLATRARAVVRERIGVKGREPVAAELKFTRHGPVIHEDRKRHRAYAGAGRGGGRNEGHHTSLTALEGRLFTSLGFQPQVVVAANPSGDRDAPYFRSGRRAPPFPDRGGASRHATWG